jgi:uracil-DNA glycosylase
MLLAGISKQWREILQTPMLTDIIDELEDQDVCPDQDKWFEWARLTELDKIKVIIIGQDPYYDGSANGLAFSTYEEKPPTVSKIPASLKNIYKCLLGQGLMKQMPTHGDLSYWAKQGVLLVNTALTTEPGTPAKHIKIWKQYMLDVFTSISNNIEKCHVFLWGRHAEKLEQVFANHFVHKWAHPSPLAQNGPEESKFINCDHFKHVDIDWNIYETVRVFTDGSCLKNGKQDSKGGFGFYFPRSNKKYIGNCIKNATNIRMEGAAIYYAMKKISSMQWNKCEIYTDSRFWIHMYTKYMPTWSKEKFEEKANADLTKKFYNLYKKLSECKIIEFIFVPSHDKSKWSEGTDHQKWCSKNNNIADRLAFKATSLP